MNLILVKEILSKIFANSVIRAAACAIVAEAGVMLVRCLHRKINQYAGTTVELDIFTEPKI